MQRYFLGICIVSMCVSTVHTGHPGYYVENSEPSLNPRAIYHNLRAKHIKIQTIESAPQIPLPGEYGYSQDERTQLIRAEVQDVLAQLAILSKNRIIQKDNRVTKAELRALRKLVEAYKEYPHSNQPVILAYDSDPDDL